MKFSESGTVVQNPGSGKSSKATAEVRKNIEKALCMDNDTTAKELQSQLSTHRHHLTKNKILLCRTVLGWMASFLE